MLRTVARGAASDFELSYDALDELGLALDEAGAALLELGSGETLRCRGARSGTGLSLSVAIDGAAGQEWPPAGWNTSLGAIVLHSVARDVEYSMEDGRPTISFTAGA